MTTVLFEKGEEVAHWARPLTHMLLVRKGEIRVQDTDGVLCATVSSSCPPRPTSTLTP